jgi:hypothetical protein
MESRMSWNNHLAGLAKALGYLARLRILQLLRRGADRGETVSRDLRRAAKRRPRGPRQKECSRSCRI